MTWSVKVRYITDANCCSCEICYDSPYQLIYLIWVLAHSCVRLIQRGRLGKWLVARVLLWRILGRTLKLLMSFNSMSRPTKSLWIRSFLDLPGAFEGILIVFCFFFIVVVETSVAIYQILWCFCPSQYFQSLLVMYELH